MRRVPLKIVPFAGPAGQPLPDLHYSEALVVIAKQPTGGLASDEIDTALQISEAIENAVDAARDAVLLEEPAWQWLCDRVKANRWPFASPTFKTLIGDVVGADKIDLNKLPELRAAE